VVVAVAPETDIVVVVADLAVVVMLEEITDPLETMHSVPLPAAVEEQVVMQKLEMVVLGKFG
jgi:hypothetical protein